MTTTRVVTEFNKCQGLEGGDGGGRVALLTKPL